MIKVTCAGICCEKEREVILPNPTGWLGEEDVRLYCEDCAPEKAFFDAVCAGCVADSSHCGLHSAYAFPDSEGLSERDAAIILTGVCPFRRNGTFLSRGIGQSIEKWDISEKADPKAAQAVVEAIRRYWVRYEKYRVEAAEKRKKESITTDYLFG